MKPIERLSLGWRTELIFPRFDAEVQQREHYLLVRTPHNPTFWWGNFLLFDEPPDERSAEQWLAWFDEEIASRQPESRHITFGVDAPAPFELPQALARRAFSVYGHTVLTMRRDQLRAPPPSTAPEFEARMLDLPRDIERIVELEVAVDEGAHPPLDGYRVFRERQMRRYAAMQRAGLGHWFGMQSPGGEGAALVADCGLFRDSPDPAALGRFQHVGTHPAWRRRGLCRALLHAVCRYGFETMGLASLVIVADPDDVAIRLYESLGFERGASTWLIERPPADELSSAA